MIMYVYAIQPIYLKKILIHVKSYIYAGAMSQAHKPVWFNPHIAWKVLIALAKFSWGGNTEPLKNSLPFLGFPKESNDCPVLSVLM